MGIDTAMTRFSTSFGRGVDISRNRPKASDGATYTSPLLTPRTTLASSRADTPFST